MSAFFTLKNRQTTVAYESLTGFPAELGKPPGEPARRHVQFFYNTEGSSREAALTF
jgi:hypothetical protein